MVDFSIVFPFNKIGLRFYSIDYLVRIQETRAILYSFV